MVYGVSHYLRQALLGYPWVSEGHPKNRLYGNPRIALEPEPWPWAVRLRPRLDDRDAIFLVPLRRHSLERYRSNKPDRSTWTFSSATIGTERMLSTTDS